MKMVALIPARAGSKRIHGKNTKLLAGQPLITYTIAAAQQSEIFERVIVCTDSGLVKTHAFALGADVWWRNPVADDQPDIVWLRDVLDSGGQSDAFSILRPTSPFRTAETIRRAYAQFCANGEGYDSLRAVEPVKQSPYKMWSHTGTTITPLQWGMTIDGTPYHSMPSQRHPLVYMQNGSLEMVWTAAIKQTQTISGYRIAPFFTQGYEGFDLNTMADWREAEYLIASGKAVLPTVHQTEPDRKESGDILAN